MRARAQTPRHARTLCYLLRGYAEQQRRMHGPLIEKPGGIELTPSEMERWAQEVEEAELAQVGRQPEPNPNADLLGE